MRWSDARMFCKAKGGRLPTEAEWDILRHDYRVYRGEDPRTEATFAIRHEVSFDTDCVVRTLREQPGVRSVRVEQSG